MREIGNPADNQEERDLKSGMNTPMHVTATTRNPRGRRRRRDIRLPRGSFTPRVAGVRVGSRGLICRACGRVRRRCGRSGPQAVGYPLSLPGAGRHQLTGPGDHRQDDDEQKPPQDDQPNRGRVRQPRKSDEVPRPFHIIWMSPADASRTMRKNEIVSSIRAIAERAGHGMPAMRGRRREENDGGADHERQQARRTSIWRHQVRV